MRKHAAGVSPLYCVGISARQLVHWWSPGKRLLQQFQAPAVVAGGGVQVVHDGVSSWHCWVSETARWCCCLARSHAFSSGWRSASCVQAQSNPVHFWLLIWHAEFSAPASVPCTTHDWGWNTLRVCWKSCQATGRRVALQQYLCASRVLGWQDGLV